MATTHPQHLVDATDGKAYPLDSFLEFYDEDEGRRRWATAGQQTVYPGVSLLHVHVYGFVCLSTSLSISLFLLH